MPINKLLIQALPMMSCLVFQLKFYHKNKRNTRNEKGVADNGNSPVIQIGIRDH